MTRYDEDEEYMCIDGELYGPCGHEFCGGVCVPIGDCPDDYKDEDFVLMTLPQERTVDEWGKCSVCGFRDKVSCVCGLTFREKVQTVKLDEEALRRCSQGPGNDWPKDQKYNPNVGG